ncbi:hypothetical protein HHL17_12530 [Chitinophaga sp. G-6-1-13]|uniref:Uncharacterized protein n=1 Tax=Chitinophaga fulva TaxID=2728842 RepID=A0A848GM18_9BACT|nr:hypothetical protein [Chitinophaga fulva]NML38022.1 hypothetical protein [Chitinophaga fulva]
MKKKTKKKLDVTKIKLVKLNEPGQQKAEKATIPPHTFWCTTTGLV